MKRLISLILVGIMLFGALAIATAAAEKETDIIFSMKSDEKAKVGETFTVEIYIDKNIGTWSAKTEIVYDNDYLTLLSCENGEVFKDSELTLGKLTAEKNDKGCFHILASLDDPNGVNENTGLFVTLKFQVSMNAPNGMYEVKTTIPDNGDGWFFVSETKDGEVKFIDRSVSVKNSVSAVVTGSSVTAEPDTNEDGVYPNTEPGETTKPPKTDVVTDNDGKVVTDENGNQETYVIEGTDTTPNYVTDADGNVETNDVGIPITEEVKDGSEIKAEESKQQAEKESEKQEKLIKLLVIISIVVAVVAAVVIVVVVTIKTKAGKGGI